MSLRVTKNTVSKSRCKNSLFLENIEAGREAMAHLTVARAVRYLVYIFDCGDHELLYQDAATSPVEMACVPRMASKPANSVAIQFWGGPPDNANWHQGTFQTLLLDKVFYCVAMGYDDIVDKFLKVLNSGRQNRETEADVPCGA
jgi:hypothetical protein